MKFRINFWSRKQWLEFLGVVIIAGFLVWSYQWYQGYKNRPVSHRFVGQISSIEGNIISLASGGYQFENGLNPANKIVKIKVDDDTMFTRTTLYLPTISEVRKTSGYYNPADLKKEVASSSLEDLKDRKVPVYVENQSANIYGMSTIKAEKISYFITIIPKSEPGETFQADPSATPPPGMFKTPAPTSK